MKCDFITFSILVAILSIALVSCTGNETEKKEANKMADLTGKKAVLIVAPTNFRDEELFHTKEVLDDAGVETYVASKGVKIAKGAYGRNSDIDIDISRLDVDDYDAVIFVGGSGTTVYLNDSTAQNIARKALEDGKVLAAICMAPSILANAGLLKDISATSTPGEEKNLRSKGARFTNERVTVDGRIITGNGPEAAYDFGRAIIEKLESDD